MAYCALTDIEKKRIPTALLIQLTDDDENPLGVINTTTVAECIADASVQVDSYLVGRYALPLSPLPPIIVSITADLAAYGIYALRPAFDPPKVIQDRRDAALALLARIQDGRMPLYEPVTLPPATGGNAVQFTGPDRLFTRDSMKGF